MRWTRWLALVSLTALASAMPMAQDAVDVRIREELRTLRADKELLKNEREITAKAEQWIDELNTAASAATDAEQRWTLRSLALETTSFGKSAKIDKARETLRKQLLDEFFDDEKKMLALIALDASPELREELARRTKSHAVQATILYAEARSLMGRARTKELDKKETEQLHELLERIAKEHGDALDSQGRKWGDVARGQLAAQRDLVIGKVAPEIDGADLDGTPFKLSDYRGKVVVLDFWGNW